MTITSIAKKYLFAVIIILFACIIIFKFQNVDNKIVYIDNVTVFNQFLMTKEMQREGEKELNLKTQYIDSLYKSLETISNISLKSEIMKKIINEKQSINNFSTEFPTEESTKIWTRITSYAEDFCNEKKYDLLLGSHPDKNILYGKQDMNVTNQFIEYINKRYEGEK